MNQSQKSDNHKKERVVAKVTLRVGQPPDTELIPPGASCEVSVEEAVDLRTRGFIHGGEAVPKDGGIKGGNDNPFPQVSQTQSFERIDAIIDAIGDLPTEDFGKDKKPNVRAIEKLLGEDITAGERDQAWEKYQSLLDGD